MEKQNEQKFERLVCTKDVGGTWAGLTLDIVGHPATGKGKASKSYVAVVVVASPRFPSYPVGRQCVMSELAYVANGGKRPARASNSASIGTILPLD